MASLQHAHLAPTQVLGHQAVVPVLLVATAHWQGLQCAQRVLQAPTQVLEHQPVAPVLLVHTCQAPQASPVLASQGCKALS